MAKVLLVEDDPLMIRMYQRKLLTDGYEVEVAVNGEEGLVKVRSFNPDLMLLDIMMPKLNGLQVLERMKADPALTKIPVIILTNLGGSQEDIERGLELGAVAYLVKSAYRPDQVLSKVKEVLAGYTRSKEVPEASATEAAQKVKEMTSAGTLPPLQGQQKDNDLSARIRDALQSEVTGGVVPQASGTPASGGGDIVAKLKELLAGQTSASQTPPSQQEGVSQKSAESDVVTQIKKLLAAQTASSGALAPAPTPSPQTTQLSDKELLEALASLIKKQK